MSYFMTQKAENKKQNFHSTQRLIETSRVTLAIIYGWAVIEAR